MPRCNKRSIRSKRGGGPHSARRTGSKHKIMSRSRSAKGRQTKRNCTSRTTAIAIAASTQEAQQLQRLASIAEASPFQRQAEANSDESYHQSSSSSSSRRRKRGLSDSSFSMFGDHAHDHTASFPNRTATTNYKHDENSSARSMGSDMACDSDSFTQQQQQPTLLEVAHRNIVRLCEQLPQEHQQRGCNSDDDETATSTASSSRKAARRHWSGVDHVEASKNPTDYSGVQKPDGEECSGDAASSCASSLHSPCTKPRDVLGAPNPNPKQANPPRTQLKCNVVRYTKYRTPQVKKLMTRALPMAPPMPFFCAETKSFTSNRC
mmetsp:Transcript_10081/g.28702  ORF Transcript_10081/g.28702 Transcript_10081/m.28702 type:complete len:321 (+) Transcript_10081:893-1855(+)